jgi:hypothetical protein
MKRIIASMIDVLVIASRGDRSQVKKEIKAKFSDRMASVGNLAFRLNKAVGEEVTSSDLSALLLHPGTRFDPTRMEDAHAAGKGELVGTGSILCTYRLGLLRRVKVSRNTWDTTTLLKAKIVLDSLSFEESEEDIGMRSVNMHATYG